MMNIPVPAVLEQKMKEESTGRRQSNEERGRETIQFPKSPSVALILEEA